MIIPKVKSEGVVAIGTETINLNRGGFIYKDQIWAKATDWGKARFLHQGQAAIFEKELDNNLLGFGGDEGGFG